MEGWPASKPRTMEEVYYDFERRRAGLIKALTSDVEKFYEQCDPEKEELSLYGLPSQNWKVDLSMGQLPPHDLPQPAVGINVARDWMDKRKWLLMVAVHSDSWLIAVAFHFAGRFAFGKTYRDRLFLMINELPTLFEVVALESGSKSPCITYHHLHTTNEEIMSEEEEIDRDGLVCGACRGGDDKQQMECWIRCDVCDLWYHCRCVRCKPAIASYLAKYKCPDCTKRGNNSNSSK